MLTPLYGGGILSWNCQGYMSTEDPTAGKDHFPTCGHAVPPHGAQSVTPGG